MTVNSYSLKSDGNINLSANFKVKEFKCNDDSDPIFISSSLINLLQAVRKYFNSPVLINSGYRTVSYNSKIGGAPYSMHTRGLAADIVVKNVDPKLVYQYLDSLYPHSLGLGSYNTFTHVDVRNERSRWNG